jgi:hypothetical protein
MTHQPSDSDSSVRPPLLINRGEVALTDSVLSAEAQTGALIYNDESAETELNRTLLIGPALYGVYLNSSSTLITDESLIDLTHDMSTEALTALYMADNSDLSTNMSSLQTDDQIILSSASLLDRVNQSARCTGEIYQLTCPSPTMEGGDLDFTPCVVDRSAE